MPTLGNHVQFVEFKMPNLRGVSEIFFVFIGNRKILFDRIVSDADFMRLRLKMISWMHQKVPTLD